MLMSIKKWWFKFYTAEKHNWNHTAAEENWLRKLCKNTLSSYFTKNLKLQKSHCLFSSCFLMSLNHVSWKQQDCAELGIFSNSWMWECSDVIWADVSFMSSLMFIESAIWAVNDSLRLKVFHCSVNSRQKVWLEANSWISDWRSSEI